MTQGFESVAHELEQKRLQLEQELSAVRGRVTEIEADLARVHDALGALTGQKKRSKGRGRARKPAPTLADLQQHIRHVREQHPFANGTELEEAVHAMVQESGSSLTGLKTLFAEALLTSPGSQAGAMHGGHRSHHEHGS